MEKAKLFEKITEYAQNHLSKDRFEHSMRVAETAAYMCKLYGLDENDGKVAGIAHDICKEISNEEMIELAKQDGNIFEEFENKKPSLLHGRAAAIKIQSEFGISDKNVIEAIANHTCGCPNLCDLGKILFVADKIEPGRPQSTDEYRKTHFKMSLNEITYSIVQENIEYLAKKGKKSAPSALMWAEELKSLVDAE